MTNRERMVTAWRDKHFKSSFEMITAYYSFDPPPPEPFIDSTVLIIFLTCWITVGVFVLIFRALQYEKELTKQEVLTRILILIAGGLWIPVGIIQFLIYLAKEWISLPDTPRHISDQQPADQSSDRPQSPPREKL